MGRKRDEGVDRTPSGAKSRRGPTLAEKIEMMRPTLAKRCQAMGWPIDDEHLVRAQDPRLGIPLGLMREAGWIDDRAFFGGVLYAVRRVRFRQAIGARVEFGAVAAWAREYVADHITSDDAPRHDDRTPDERDVERVALYRELEAIICDDDRRFLHQAINGSDLFPIIVRGIVAARLAVHNYSRLQSICHLVTGKLS